MPIPSVAVPVSSLSVFAVPIPVIVLYELCQIWGKRLGMKARTSSTTAVPLLSFEFSSLSLELLALFPLGLLLFLLLSNLLCPPFDCESCSLLLGQKFGLVAKMLAEAGE